MKFRHSIRISLALAILSTIALAAISCSSTPEPIDGFWSYNWGTPYDSILADSADIKLRLGGDNFKLERTPARMTFQDVQYGMGYDRVVLDFTPEGQLWHGQVRIRIANDSTVDSALTSLHARYGDDTGKRTIKRDSGYVTYWYTRTWLDRDFYSASIKPEIAPQSVKRIDLKYGGCPSECPIYTIRLLSSGDAYLWSVRGLEEVGGFRGVIGLDTFLGLAREAVSTGFLSLADVYEYDEVDLPTAGVRVDYGKFTQSSESLAGSGPADLEDFVARLDSATNEIVWHRVASWDTIRIFDQYHVDIDSLEKLGESQQP